MNRRTLLAAGLGVGSFAGCLESDARSADDGTGTESPRDGSDDADESLGTEPDPDSNGEASADDADGEYDWRHDVGGWVDAVADGTVYGREYYLDEDVDGSIFALDRETGERLWSYGQSSWITFYAPLTVEDGIYVATEDDQVGGGSGETLALEPNGDERWSRRTGTVYARPRVVDGTFYVAEDGGTVRAFAATDGTERWRTPLAEGSVLSVTEIVGIDDYLYVTVQTGRLVALDRGDGSVHWSYDEADERSLAAAVTDESVYVSNRDEVVALADGEERWHTSFESDSRIVDADGERVLVGRDDDLVALEPTTGDPQWRIADVDSVTPSLSRDRIYVAGEQLRAYDANTGDLVWSDPVRTDSSRIESVRIVDDVDGAEYAVFARTGDARLHRIDPAGSITWTGSVPESIRSFVVDGRSVVVGTDGGIYSLALE